jgi:hypothetical protein
VTPTDDRHPEGNALGEELLAADDAHRRREQLAGDLEQVLADTETWKTEVESATAELEAESEDVDDLESVTPARIWATVRGSRDARLDQERRERLEAATRLEVARYNHDAGLERAARLRRSMIDLDDAAERRAAAMDAMQEWVLTSGGPSAGRLRGVVDELAVVRAEIAELVATEATVEEAATRLAEAAGWLLKAGDWATYDTFLGGGLIGDAIKYDRIDKAKWSIGMAQESLRAMSEALTDIGMTSVRGVEVDSLTGVFDVWFDNIFSDMAVRGRIREAADRVQDARATVTTVHTELAGRRERATGREAELMSAREELLIAAADG